MKGTYFHKPLELVLNVDGETWNQGDPIKGNLVIKNHGASSVSVQDIRVQLAHGELKKVRLKSEDAFKTIHSSDHRSDHSSEGSSQTNVAPQSQLTLEWSFVTDKNVPITDNSGSLFLLYGSTSQKFNLGQLQLTVAPHNVIQEFLKTFEVDFRFVVKTKKATKTGTEVKLLPPAGQSFAKLDDLSIGFRFEDKALHLRYTFNVKKIEATAASIDVKKMKKDFTQSLEESQYRLPSGRINYEFFQTSIREIVSQIESKILF